MKKYEILEHTADLKIKVFGKTKEELFKNALLGMMNALRAETKNQKSPKESKLPAGQAKIKKIKVKSLNIETLLVDFLSEVLYFTQINQEVYRDIKFKKLTDTEIEGELVVQEVERFGEDIKGVTYHDLDIHQRKDRIWEATVLFDL